jgi:nitroreductase
MNVYEAIKTRKSVRKFKKQKVPEKKLTRILEAARLAPSASNRQEWRFVVVRDPQKRQALAKASMGQKFIGTAPIVLACCAKTDEHRMGCGQMSYPIDIAIAVDHITLAAVEEGLGTCWIGAFSEEKVKKLLEIPDAIRVVALLPLGVPFNSSKKEKSRLSQEQIVHWDTWS